MTELTTKLAEALRLISFASVDRGARDTATEALRLYDEATALPVQDLPPLPDAHWVEEFSHGTLVYTAEQMRDYARAAQAATPAPAEPVAWLRDAQEQPFEDWWERDGQFCRAGGGAYGKIFAWAAFQAGREWGLALAATPAPAPLTTEQTAKLFAEVNSLMPGLDTPEEMFATIVRFVEREHRIGQGKEASNG